jgi:hypothetical protein
MGAAINKRSAAAPRLRSAGTGITSDPKSRPDNFRVKSDVVKRQPGAADARRHRKRESEGRDRRSRGSRASIIARQQTRALFGRVQSSHCAHARDSGLR